MPRVVGLAQTWATSAQRLEAAFANAPVKNWQTRALQRQAGRCRSSADAVAASALDGAPFEHVSEEFRELDDAWQRLVARTSDSGLASSLLATEARRIAAVDHAMHEVLYVESSALQNERLVEPLLHDVMRTTSELDRELDVLSSSRLRGAEYWPLRTANAELSSQVRSALRDVQAGKPIYSLRARADAIERAWRQTEAAAAGLRGNSQAGYAVSLVDQMETVMQRLARVAAGEFNWRYQITP